MDNLLTRNSSLLFKWWWRWFSERKGFWWEIIKQKYQLNEHQGFNQCESLSNMSYIMRDICAPHKVHQWSAVFNEQAYRWILGNVEKILFWEDVWLCAISLAQKYPRLYSISRWKFCNIQLVISKWQELGSARWTRELRAWESDLEKEMSSLLGTLVFKDYKDLVIWKQNDNLFVTRDCYRLLE